MHRALQRSLQFTGLEAKGTGLAFVSHAAGGIDQVKAIGPCGISLFGGVAELIEHGGHLNAQLAHAGAGYGGAFFFAPGTGKDHLIFDVALHLPNVAGMRFGDVDNQKRNLAAVLAVELVEGGNLPPERRSSIAPENEHDRLMLRGQCRELYVRAFVELRQREVRGAVAGL